MTQQVERQTVTPKGTNRTQLGTETFFKGQIGRKHLPPFEAGEIAGLDLEGLYRHPDFDFDPHEHAIRRKDQSIHLTGVETRLMQTLVAHPNRVLPYDYLCKNVWL